MRATRYPIKMGSDIQGWALSKPGKPVSRNVEWLKLAPW